jgi:hypothetical protein
VSLEAATDKAQAKGFAKSKDQLQVPLYAMRLQLSDISKRIVCRQC